MEKIIRDNLEWLHSDGKKGKNADLEGANLQKADLWGADLQEAVLEESNLKEAVLENANLGYAILELATDGLPNIPSIAKACGLPYLRYSESPHSLVELREGFKKAGLRKQEREVTYAIKHTGFLKAKSEGDWLTRTEVYLGWFFFELTCKWGMAPERPLFILVGLIFLFTMPYAQAISQNMDWKQKTDGIWKVWIPGRIREDLGKEEPKTLLDSISAGFCFRLGFYFSLLSCIRAVREVLPHMRAAGGGRILCSTSSSIKAVLDNLILSNTFRSAVVGLAKSLSQELGRDGILVNVIAPGRIGTARIDQLDRIRAGKAGIPLEDLRENTFRTIPLGRYGRPTEYARLAVFLCSEANTYITGQSVLVDGGLVKAI
jgi:hypothetical protein